MCTASSYWVAFINTQTHTLEHSLTPHSPCTAHGRWVSEWGENRRNEEIPGWSARARPACRIAAPTDRPTAFFFFFFFFFFHRSKTIFIVQIPHTKQNKTSLQDIEFIFFFFLSFFEFFVVFFFLFFFLKGEKTSWRNVERHGLGFVFFFFFFFFSLCIILLLLLLLWSTWGILLLYPTQRPSSTTKTKNGKTWQRQLTTTDDDDVVVEIITRR